MALKQLTKAAIALLKKNPELAEELGRIGKSLTKVTKGKEKVVKPTPTRFTGAQKNKVKLYVDPNGNNYTSVRKGLEDIKSGKAISKAKWNQLAKEERPKKAVEKKPKKKKEYTAEEEAVATRKVKRAKKVYEAEFKRVDIKPSRVKEGGKKYKENMQKVVNILGNETTNMRNLRAAGEKPRGGITGLMKSLEGPEVGSPYRPGGKFYRPPATHARPLQSGIDIQTGAIPQEGRHLEEEAIKALGLSRKEEIKRLKKLELFYGRKPTSIFDPETGQPLGTQLISEAKVRGDIPLTGIIGGRDVTGRPLSKHLPEIVPSERNLIMSTIRERVPGLTQKQRQRIAKDILYKGESKLPKGFIDEKTGDDVIIWRLHPERESKYPIETAGINKPIWNEEKQRWENLTSQTRFRQERPAEPKGLVAEEMGLRGSPSQIINPELIKGAAVTRPQALEHLPEVAYTPPYVKSPVTRFPAQRGSIDLPMAKRAEQTGALSQPLDVTQKRILENLQRSRRAEKLTGRGEEEVIRQAGMQARAAGVRRDPTLRTFAPDLKAPVPKVTVKQKAVEKAQEKINREVIAIRAKKREFDRLVANGIETPESLLKRKDHKAWSKKRKTLKNTINKKYPQWQEYIPDESGVPVWQGKYVDSFKKGSIIARKTGGQLQKPRGWGAARYKI
jgi:hypothetical protein